MSVARVPESLATRGLAMSVVRIFGFFLFLASIASCMTPFASEGDLSAAGTIGFILLGIVLMFFATLLVGVTQYDADTKEMARQTREMQEEWRRKSDQMEKELEERERREQEQKPMSPEERDAELARLQRELERRRGTWTGL